METVMTAGVIDIREFPFVEELPKREKSRVAKLWDVLEELKRIQDERGPVISQALAAEALAVSRQRVSDLVAEGKLESILVGEHRFVFLDAVKQRAQSEREKGGRPPLTKVQTLKKAWRVGSAIGDGLADAIGAPK